MEELRKAKADKEQARKEKAKKMRTDEEAAAKEESKSQLGKETGGRPKTKYEQDPPMGVIKEDVIAEMTFREKQQLQPEEPQLTLDEEYEVLYGDLDRRCEELFKGLRPK